MKKKIKICLLVVSICSFLIGCSGGPDYELGEDQIYVRDSQECIAYRVVVDTDITDEEMEEIYEDVIDNDGYYLHTVWFFDNEDDADGTSAYTVAEMEEINQGEIPNIMRAIN